MKADDKYSLSLAEANLKSLFIVLPIVAIYLLLSKWFLGWEKTGHEFLMIYDHFGLALVLLIVGIFLHELLHGITWILWADLKWSDVKYGFNVSAMAPYAHCRVPVSARAYRMGIVSPGVLLGIIPFIAGLVGGQTGFLIFGFIFTLAAGGDFLMLWVIRGISGDSSVEDHPERLGCKIVSKG